MSKRIKTIQKMRDNPTNWQIAALETLAQQFDIQVRKSGGSHVVFMHEDSALVVSIPAKRPIKPIYITQFIALVNDIGENSEKF